MSAKPKLVRVLILTVLVATSACQDVQAPVTSVHGPLRALGGRPNQWPYDPTGRSQRFIANTMPDGPTTVLDRPLPPQFRRLPKPIIDSSLVYQPDTPGSSQNYPAHSGWWLLDGPAGRGVFINNLWIGKRYDTGTWLAVPNVQPDGSFANAIIYAPTTLPAGGTCIEATVVHSHAQYSGLISDHALGFWDWCGDANHFHNQIDLTTPANQATYEEILLPDFNAQELTLAIYIVPDHPSLPSGSSDCWTAYLYNSSLSAYEQKFRSCGTPPNDNHGVYNGWIMHESYRMQGPYSPTCPTLQSTGANGVSVNVNGTWQTVLEPGDPANNPAMTAALLVDGACWLNSTYTIYNEPAGVRNGWFGMTPGAS